MDTIPNAHDPEWRNCYDPEWTKSRTDMIPNGHNTKWIQTQMDNIPNGQYPELALSRMDLIPNGYEPEWIKPKWTPFRMDSIPNGNNFAKIPNRHHPKWTQSQIVSRTNTFPNEHNLVRTQLRMCTYMYTLLLKCCILLLGKDFLQRINLLMQK